MGALTNAPPSDVPAALAAGPPPAAEAGLRAWRRMGLPVRIYLVHALRRARLRLRLRGRVAFEGPSFVGAGAVVEVNRGARLVLGRWCWLGDGVLVRVRRGQVRIGSGTALGQGCSVAAHEGIDVGERCLVGDRAMLVDFDHETGDVERPVRLQGLVTGPIRIHDGARIGAGACVLRGVTVGAGAEVGPRSVVTRDVPPGAAVEGAPAVESPPTPPPGRRSASGR